MPRFEKILRLYQICMLIPIATLAALTFVWVCEVGVRAPLLTLIGGVTIIISFNPPTNMALRNITQGLLTLVGTSIAILGAFHWLQDATQALNYDDRLLSFIIAAFSLALLSIHLIVSMVILILTNWGNIKEIVRRVMRR